MFEKQDEIINKRIAKIDKKIDKAKKSIEKIELKSAEDTEIEEFSSERIKIKSYEEFIIKAEKEKEEIERFPYSIEDIREVAKEIQKIYNPKFRKALLEVIAAAKQFIIKQEEYRKLNVDFSFKAEEFYKKCNKSKAPSEEWEGCLHSYGEPIVNDNIMYFKELAERIELKLQALEKDGKTVL